MHISVICRAGIPTRVPTVLGAADPDEPIRSGEPVVSVLGPPAPLAVDRKVNARDDVRE